MAIWGKYKGKHNILVYVRCWDLFGFWFVLQRKQNEKNKMLVGSYVQQYRRNTLLTHAPSHISNLIWVLVLLTSEQLVYIYFSSIIESIKKQINNKIDCDLYKINHHNRSVKTERLLNCLVDFIIVWE